jgi:hypothetical protein
MQFRDSMSVGPVTGHKIESGPTENVASRRNLQQLYPAEEESLEGYHLMISGRPLAYSN